jgi:hypothetical protein
MATGLSPRSTWQYFLKEDLATTKDDEGIEIPVVPIEKRTTFRLKFLPSKTRLDLENIATMKRKGDVSINVGSIKWAAMKAGLAGWENFLDGDGNPIPFETDKGRRNISGIVVENPPTDDTLDRLTPGQIQELADVIVEGNTLTKDDRKN